MKRYLCFHSSFYASIPTTLTATARASSIQVDSDGGWASKCLRVTDLQSSCPAMRLIKESVLVCITWYVTYLHLFSYLTFSFELICKRLNANVRLSSVIQLIYHHLILSFCQELTSNNDMSTQRIDGAGLNLTMA